MYVVSNLSKNVVLLFGGQRRVAPLEELLLTEREFEDATVKYLVARGVFCEGPLPSHLAYKKQKPVKVADSVPDVPKPRRTRRRRQKPVEEVVDVDNPPDPEA